MRKEEIMIQLFFDVLLSFCWEEKLNVKEDREALQEIINRWIENGCPKFYEDKSEELFEQWVELLKGVRLPKAYLRKQWSWLYLNYSPKYTIRQEKTPI